MVILSTYMYVLKSLDSLLDKNVWYIYINSYFTMVFLMFIHLGGGGRVVQRWENGQRRKGKRERRKRRGGNERMGERR